MDKFTAMKTFRRVVECGGFAAAARALNLSNAAVSGHVRDLEDALGAALLVRTTRKVSMTEAGRAYFDRCIRILDDIEEAERSLGALQASPRGLLRVNAPMAMGDIDAGNRIVMAPMTRSRADDAGVVGPLTAEYYA